MRKVPWISVFLLVAAQAFAQRGGGGHAGGGHAVGGGSGHQSSTHIGLPPVRPIPPLDGAGRGRHYGGRAYTSGGYPYAAGYDYGYAQAPNEVVVEQAPPPVIVQQAPPPPPQPPRPALYEYKPGSLPEPGPPAEPRTFAIILRDGSVHEAMAVWVQEDTLHYMDSDGRHRQTPLDAVDRQSSRRVNRERQLELNIPAPAAR